MASFQYKGIDGAGKRVSGTLEAASTSQALANLAKRGCQVFDLKEAGRQAQAHDPGAGKALLAGWFRRGKTKVSQSDLLVAVQELATLLEAGVPLADGVENIAQGYAGHPLGEIGRASCRERVL